MERSGFFNAILQNGVPDRTYNAEDYRNMLSVVVSSGVLRSTNDDLKVTASGLVCTVAAGWAFIKGGYYQNNSPYSFAATTVPSGGSRIDRIVLRLDDSISVRSINLAYVQGTASNTPVAPTPVRANGIYEIVLADVLVTAGGTSVTVTDKRADSSVCGWVYSTAGDNSFFTSLDNSFNTWFQGAKNTLSSVTLFKRYQWSETLASSTSTVQFNIPQYDADTCFLEVYVNGVFDTRHTISGNVITFTGTLVGGTKVNVNCYKSIDGTGITTVADEITELQGKVASLEAEAIYTYNCTGANDNISLSQIAQAFLDGEFDSTETTAAAAAFLTKLGGNTWLAALEDDAQITIQVAGKLGATTPFSGDGTDNLRYKWFALGKSTSSNKKIVFDFAKCEHIGITGTNNKNNIVFYGQDLYIKNATVAFTNDGVGCTVELVGGETNKGTVEVENCKLKAHTTGQAVVGRNGTFTNCYCWIASIGENAICFSPVSESLIRVIGGTQYAYIKTSGKVAAIFRTTSDATNAVIMAQNINVPTISYTGYSQQYLSIGGGGNTYINGVVSTQTSTGTTNNIVGQIWKSKR